MYQRFFGTKKKPFDNQQPQKPEDLQPEPQQPEPQQPDTAAQLNSRISTLELQVSDIQKNVESIMKSELNIDAKKRKIMPLLKRKKMLETHLENLMSTQIRIDQMQCMESSFDNSSLAFQILSEGTKKLKEQKQNIDIDQMHELMEDMREQQQELSELYSPFVLPEDTSVEQEFADLCTSEGIKNSNPLSSAPLRVTQSRPAQTAPEFPELPAVPTHKIGSNMRTSELKRF